MGRVAKRVVRELRRSRSRDVIDLSTFREMRATRAPEAGHLDDFRDAPTHGFWIRALADLAVMAWPLLELWGLRKLADRVDQSEVVFMPGGLPMSPLTDSFHTMWMLADTTVGLDRETLCSIAIAVAKTHGVRADVLELWRAIERSYPGLYVVVRREATLVELEELVTGERAQVEMVDEIWGPPGCLWWTRLLPSLDPEGRAASIVTPYVFPEVDAVEFWREYLDRALADIRVPSRSEAYRLFMKRGPARPFGWFDYIRDGYHKVLDNAVALVGVPDRPETLPHSERGKALRERAL